MKKLLFLICTAVLFCMTGAVQAQQQDEKSKQSNQYRTQQNQQADTTANDQEAMQDNQNMQPENEEVEVVESKEGPNSEVVYRYQGDLFYVDREEKKLVKADESELKDATHKTIVKDNTTIQNNSARRNRDNQ
jgi:MFS superfamily sulfate permease-like transporter